MMKDEFQNIIKYIKYNQLSDIDDSWVYIVNYMLLLFIRVNWVSLVKGEDFSFLVGLRGAAT